MSDLSPTATLDPRGQLGPRYHAMDALRAIAMLLGIGLHAGVCYMQTPPSYWTIRDSSPYVGFDVTIIIIHAFRMQVFFIMAGFFAALLGRKIGTRAFIRHRVRRILIPLLLGVLLIVPLVRLAFLFGATRTAGEPFWPAVSAWLSTNPLLVYTSPTHLWFLEYLLIMYVLALAVFVPIGRALSASQRAVLDDMARRVVRSPYKPFALALLTVWPMLQMKSWNVQDPLGFIPPRHLIGYYLVFFLFGWLLYRARDELNALTRWWRAYIIIALFVVLPGMFAADAAQNTAAADTAIWIERGLRAASGVLTWLLTFGVIGLFLTWYDRPNPTMRYIADSSYWMYLVHFPLVLYLNVVLAPLPWPAVLKFAVVLGITVPLLLASYHFFVRYTVIGRTLNGPRTRAADRRAPAPIVERMTKPLDA